MNVCDTHSYGDALMCQIWYDYVKGQKAVAWAQSHVKNYKFDLDVIGQHRIGIMNVRDSSSCGDTPMCQI